MEKRKKVATAKKRDLQGAKKFRRNHSMKSRVSTAIKKLKTHTGKGKELVLSLLYSLVDKAVKKNIYHRNKGKRIKSKASKI